MLANFLGTYASRHSDFRGYWLFGFLVGDLDEVRIDLLSVPRDIPEGPLGFAISLAVEKFEDQLRKGGVATSRVLSGRLTLRRSPNAVRGIVNGHVCRGYNVHFVAEAVMKDGRRYVHEHALFVAPHDPAAERQSIRPTKPSQRLSRP